MEAAIQLGPDTPDAGFASMLAQLVRQNLDDHPAKQTTFSQLMGRATFVATDLGLSVTLDFRGGALTVSKGFVGIPDVTICAPSDAITKMSLAELGRFGLPDPRGTNNREIFQSMRKGEIKGFGVLTNLPFVLRLTQVMSVN